MLSMTSMTASYALSLFSQDQMIILDLWRANDCLDWSRPNNCSGFIEKKYLSSIYEDQITVVDLLKLNDYPQFL